MAETAKAIFYEYESRLHKGSPDEVESTRTSGLYFPDSNSDIHTHESGTPQTHHFAEAGSVSKGTVKKLRVMAESMREEEERKTVTLREGDKEETWRTAQEILVLADDGILTGKWIARLARDLSGSERERARAKTDIDKIIRITREHFGYDRAVRQSTQQSW